MRRVVLALAVLAVVVPLAVRAHQVLRRVALGYEGLTAPSTSRPGYPAGGYSELHAGDDRSLGQRVTVGTSDGVLRPRIAVGWRF